MAGVDHAAAGKILEEYVGVDAARRGRGEPFEWQGRTVTRHARSPRRSRTRRCSSAGECPPRRGRAARLRLPMLPMNTDQVVRDAYAEESERVGFIGDS